MALTETVAQITARRQREDAAEHKAATAPSTLTEAELTSLRPATLAAAMAAGHLAHLGYGGSSGKYR